MGEKWVFARDNGMPEERNHVKLLHEAIHIADASKILKADITSRRLHFVQKSYDPIINSSSSPLACFVKLNKVRTGFVDYFRVVE